MAPSSVPDAPAPGPDDVLTPRWEGRRVEDWRAAWEVPRLVVFERLGSTNDYARAWAESGAPAGAVVLAEEQTAGRGRRGRRWHAPAGRALLLSLVLRPARSGTAGAAPELAPGAAPLRVGLAAAGAIERVTGVRVAIKWPNDLLADERKLAGVLCEGALGDARAGYVVAGIGVNVAQRPEDWPPELRPRATSLLLAAGRVIPRAPLAGAIIRALHEEAARIALPLDDAEVEALAARDHLRGRRVRVDELVGSAAGVDRDGSLCIRTEDGRTVRAQAGTVELPDG